MEIIGLSQNVQKTTIYVGGIALEMEIASLS